MEPVEFQMRQLIERLAHSYPAIPRRTVARLARARQHIFEKNRLVRREFVPLLVERALIDVLPAYRRRALRRSA
jgi:hypothetical protein